MSRESKIGKKKKNLRPTHYFTFFPVNSREDKNHIYVVFFLFFLMYTIISLSMVSGVSLWCCYVSESLFISCFFCSSCRAHTHTVCVLFRVCIVHCRTDVTTAGLSSESTCETHVCVVFRYQFCMWKLCFEVWELGDAAVFHDMNNVW